MQDAFTSAAAMEGRAWTYQAGDQVTRLVGRAVTPEFFDVFGVSPALGRFLNGDDRNSLVLSYEMWQTRFGGDPGVVGRTLVLDDTPHQVVGVAPKDFRFPPDSAAWSPLILSPERLSQRGNNMNPVSYTHLTPGACRSAPPTAWGAPRCGRGVRAGCTFRARRCSGSRDSGWPTRALRRRSLPARAQWRRRGRCSGDFLPACRSRRALRRPRSVRDCAPGRRRPIACRRLRRPRRNGCGATARSVRRR